MPYSKKTVFPKLEELNYQIREIKRGSEEILMEDEFIKKFQESQFTKKPLIVKFGLDPTAPDIHLGHTVILNKLRQFQDFGHIATLLIGDFTAIIGDPSGRNSARPALTKDQVLLNAKTYYDQISKILNPSGLKVLYNSKWYADLKLEKLIELASRCTVARMIERQDFSNRLKKGIPILMHEFFYPIMQGYDSVSMNADVELGGVDQKFNLLIGRELQRGYQKKPQSILTMPLLLGTDGIEKMSKSKNNHIGIMESPNSMFGKLMSISDNLMWAYFDLLSFSPRSRINTLKKEVQDGRNPKGVKILLAKEIVARFHCIKDANKAEEDFEARFRLGIPPKIMLEVKLNPAPMSILKVLKESSLVISSSEAQRNISQGGVRINNEKIGDKSLKLDSGTYIIQVGKRRFARVHLS